MKHRFLFFTLIMFLLGCLTACTYYEQDAADRITEKGTEMMQLWLDENIPDAELTECSAFINNIRYSRQEYLFDYAIGRITLNGNETGFAIDTITGDVYFENDRSVKEELNRIAADFLYETMGIAPEGSDDAFECYVLAPFRDENHELKAYQCDYGFDFGLPAGIKDIENFVRNPASRPLLYVQANITLSDETDISEYNFETFDKLGRECGMLFGYISVENSTQTFKRETKEWMTIASFYENGQWIEQNGIYITGPTRVRAEEHNDLTGKMTVSDRSFDPLHDMVFEETETGYRYYLPDKDWTEGFYIRAHEGARMLKHNYIKYFYDDVSGFIEGKYNSDEKEGSELIWQKQSNGDYVLVAKKNGAPEYFSHAGKLERAE